MQNWDYGWNAYYFITICTEGREFYFGEIVNKKMKLSEIGILANKFWLEIPKHFQHVTLDEYIIMPDHIHGIILIDKPKSGDRGNNTVKTRQCLVSTAMNTNKNEDNKTVGQTRFRNQGKNTLSSIIGSFKSVVTKNARKINPDFSWQSRFHDHVVRDEKSLHNIRRYIKTILKNGAKTTLEPSQQTKNELS